MIGWFAWCNVRPMLILCANHCRGGSLSSDTGEAPEAVLYPARVSSLSDTELDALVAEAVLN
jgi:hypothetical protein